MVTYPKVEDEEFGLLDLEASTHNILNKNSWSIFEIRPTWHLHGYDRLQLIATH